MNRYFMDPHPVRFTRRIGGISAPTVRHVWHVKDKERPTEFGNHKSVANSGNPYVAQRICDMLNGEQTISELQRTVEGVKVTHLGHTAEYWHGLFEARGQDMNRMKAQRDAAAKTTDALHKELANLRRLLKDVERQRDEYSASVGLNNPADICRLEKEVAEAQINTRDMEVERDDARRIGVNLANELKECSRLNSAQIGNLRAAYELTRSTANHLAEQRDAFSVRLQDVTAKLQKQSIGWTAEEVAELIRQRDEYAAKCEGLATPEAVRRLENMVDDARSTANHLANERNQARRILDGIRQVMGLDAYVW